MTTETTPSVPTDSGRPDRDTAPMRRPDDSAPRRRRVLVEHEVAVWTLAASAGFVVAVSFELLAHVEVGPMTGNTVATANGLAAHGASADFTRAIAIVGFVLGVASGIVIAEETARHAVRRTMALMLGIEIVLLVAYMLWGASLYRDGGIRAGSHWLLDALVLLPSLALGLQTAALRRVRGQTARTTYISGVLTRTVEETVRLLYWRRDRRRGETAAPWHNEPSLARTLLLGGIFVAYVSGAVLGAFLRRPWQLYSLAVPIGALTVIAIIDVVVASGPPSR
jgi:uncharacterized membrane protein YoaK (UPF0700 family)